MNASRILLLTVGLAVFFGGCRGYEKTETPIHLNPNMDLQKRLDAQAPSDFFADGRAMRQPVEGTVARGSLHEDDHLWRGKVDDEWATELPMPLTAELLERGQDRFNIYCAVCHDQTGSGQSVVAKRGIVPPPTYHQERIRSLPIGQIYDIASNGVRTMPGYRNQVNVRDRWAIVAYVRALQISQFAAPGQVPADKR